MFARTERLLLRPGWREDAPALVQAIADEAIVRNLATAPWPYRFADAETFLMRERPPSDAACLIFLRTESAPRLIGGVGFGRMPSGEREFGYWIARSDWGRGYATEAGRALLAGARDTLRLAQARRRPFPRQSRVRTGAGQARLQADRSDGPPPQPRPRRRRPLPPVRARPRGRGGRGRPVRDGGLV